MYPSLGITRVNDPQLLTVVGYNVWIGYNKTKWLDGTSVDYNKWAHLEPGNSNCAVLKACRAKPTFLNLCATSLIVQEGKWYGTSCNQGTALGFVCKKRCSEYQDLITGRNGFTEASFDAIKQQIINLDVKTQTGLANDEENRVKPIPDSVRNCAFFAPQNSNFTIWPE